MPRFLKPDRCYDCKRHAHHQHVPAIRVNLVHYTRLFNLINKRGVPIVRRFSLRSARAAVIPRIHVSAFGEFFPRLETPPGGGFFTQVSLPWDYHNALADSHPCDDPHSIRAARGGAPFVYGLLRYAARAFCRRRHHARTPQKGSCQALG
jgi:hypothetical protein